MRIKTIFLVALLAVGFASCSDDDDVPSNTGNSSEMVTQRGMYVLSEGTLNHGDSRLAYYNLADHTWDLTAFMTSNDDANLGDTAEDLIIYGSKMYITLNGTDQVKVLDAQSRELLQEITIEQTSDAAVSPRFMVGAKGQVYISTWTRGVIVMDTLDYAIKKEIPLSGAFSEEMVRIDNNLYVANSGNEITDGIGGQGTTVSVISLDTDTETGTITVPVNPNKLRASSDNKLYVSSWGDFYMTDASISELNINTLELVKTWDDVKCSQFCVAGNYLYCYHFSYLDFQFHYTRIDRTTGETYPFISEDQASEIGFKSPYSLSTDPETQDFYIGDESGLLVHFSKDGGFIDSWKVNPEGQNAMRINHVVFVSKEVPAEETAD